MTVELLPVALPPEDLDLDGASAALAALLATRPDSPGAVRIEREGPVAHVVLDHPAARNALSVRMMAELAEAMRGLHAAAKEGSGPTAVVLRSSSGAFCSGGFLLEVESTLTLPRVAPWMAATMTVVLDALRDGPWLTVAVLDGPAVGGGVELALAADARFASTEAFLELRQVALGVAAGWGGAARLVSLVGRSCALRLLTTAARISASEARALGLVDGVGEEPLALAFAWLARPLSLPAASVIAAKRQIVAADRGDKAAERDAFLQVWGGPAHRDGFRVHRR